MSLLQSLQAVGGNRKKHPRRGCIPAGFLFLQSALGCELTFSIFDLSKDYKPFRT